MRIVIPILLLALMGCEESTSNGGGKTSFCGFDDMALNGSNRPAGETAYVFIYEPSDRVVIAFFEDGTATHYDPSDAAGTIADGTWEITQNCELIVTGDDVFTLTYPTLHGNNRLETVEFLRDSDSKLDELSPTWDESPQYLAL